MNKTVKVTYNADTLETTIVVNGKKFDTSRINGMEIADWAYPFMMRKIRWNGFYDEMVHALGSQKAFDLVFEGSEEALAELKEAWEDAPVNVVSSGGGNVVVITYNAEALTTKITVNGQTFNTSRINGKKIEDWIYPFMMRKVKWDGIFEELAKVIGSEEYTIQFSGSNEAMKELMAECPDEVEICKEKGGESVKSQWTTSLSKSSTMADNQDVENEIEEILSIWDDMDNATEQQKKDAFDRLYRIAEQGHPKAQNELGDFYKIGIGTAKNEKKGVEYHKLSAEQGFSDAIDELGKCYELGVGVAPDDELAFEYYQKAADLGNYGGIVHVAEWYNDWYLHEEWLERRGLDYEEAIKQSIPLLKKALEAVQKEDMPFRIFLLAHTLGDRYYDGEGVKKDKREAARYYEIALDSGFDEAFDRHLTGAINYWNGNEEYGQEPNKRKAIDLWKIAAEKGNATAQCNLGNCYFSGEGVNQNDNEALKWYKMAAEQDYNDSCTMTGFIYYNINQNYQEAVRYFKKAVKLNPDDETALYFLGLCYLSGKGVPKNKNKGIQYIQAASENGCEEATSLLKNKQLMKKIYENIGGVLDIAGMIPIPQVQEVVGGLKAAKGIADRFVNNTDE
ncbi:MAG: sel1 repeat family protein [Ruminococcus sp.]|nr:sel1 repeat family protein [Ruminococcus sp.]